MFTVTCGLEVRDLYYAVLTRQQVLERELKEASERRAEELQHYIQAEINRLDIVKHNLYAHLDDHDYRFDRIAHLFPEG